MNIIEQKLEELSREEEIAQILEERRINELNDMILDKFIEIQKSQATNKNKAREWGKFVKDFCQQNEKDLHAINLKIDADFLRSQMGHASIICQDGWNFYFKVSLFGQFDKVFFSEAQFFDHFWAGAVFKEVVKFHNVFFNECATFYESLFEDLVSFRKVIFENGANFTRNEFDGEAHFEIESKIEYLELKHELKRKEINFEGSEFTKKSDFELRNLEVFQLSFEGCKFCGEFLLQSENSAIRFLNLQSTVFSEIARFVPYSYRNRKKLIGDIKVEYTAFMKSAIFEIEFEKCPDFSKCYFLEKVFIKETWPEIVEKKVKAYEKEKFLFLKSYYASIKNHLKENQYFGYEMRAREIGLETELYSKFKGRRFRHFVFLICKMASKKVRKILVARCKIVSVKYCELFLFKCYKWFSGYGASVEKPLMVLIFSFLYFGYYFERHNVPKPYESSFVRTLNPLYDSGKGYSTLLDMQIEVAFQSLINGILLFLIFLGIRNRFRIKS